MPSKRKLILNMIGAAVTTLVFGWMLLDGFFLR
jgi:hypothetical protein